MYATFVKLIMTLMIMAYGIATSAIGDSALNVSSDKTYLHTINQTFFVGSRLLEVRIYFKNDTFRSLIGFDINKNN